MNQSLERIVFIGLNLALLASTGIPLLVSTTQIISESERQLEYQQFIDEVDEMILYVQQNQVSATRQVSIPNNITVSALHNQLVFRFYLNTWFVVTRSYEYNITVEGPAGPGSHLLSVSLRELIIQVLFQLS
jgi:hypothetical protein